MSKFSGLALDSESPRPLELLDPATGFPLVSSEESGKKKAIIYLKSHDSKQAMTFDKALMISRRTKAASVSPEDIEADLIKKLALLTTGWDICDLSGEPIDVPFSVDNAIELYTELNWVYEQASNFSQRRANYKKL